MMVPLLDPLALTTTVALGVALAGVYLTRPRPTEGAPAGPSRSRRLALTLCTAFGVANGGLALLRLLLVPVRDAGAAMHATTGLMIAVTTVAMAVTLWRSERADAERRSRAERARSDADGGGLPASPATAEATPGALPAGRTTVPAFEGDAPVAQESLGESAGEFDDRLMHANRMQSIGRLAGGIAHDFNNLLTSILTSAEMAQEALPAEHGIAPDLEEIRRAGTRAGELTRQLLAFARRDVSRPRVIDANTLVANLATMLRRVLGETIELRIALGSDLPLLHADPAQLEQVIVNLAVNARDAMPHGGVLQLRTLRADASATGVGAPAPRGIALEVQDSGLGMSEEVRSRLFEPFFTTKNPGRGTGLGLALCQAIVAAHGGEIAVASAPGEGSLFRIWLPATEDVHESRAAAAPDSLQRTASDSPQVILLVEDDADVRGSTARALRRAGYVVIDAIDGEDALRQVASRTTPVDLVVTDIVMPRVGGAELARRLTERWPELQVLFMSGYPRDSREVSEVERTGAPVLEKPYTQAILLFEIRLRLESRHPA